MILKKSTYNNNHKIINHIIKQFFNGVNLLSMVHLCLNMEIMVSQKVEGKMTIYHLVDFELMKMCHNQSIKIKLIILIKNQ